jgi:alpha-tubulin suppressor-like RCC1 family protein
VQITAGANHTCVLLDRGAVRCWGENKNGQLGYGHTHDIGDKQLPASAGDVPLGGRAVQISAGGLHTCAVLDTGRLRCWGDNEWGQLGYGHKRNIGDDETPASAGDVPVL